MEFSRTSLYLPSSANSDYFEVVTIGAIKVNALTNCVAIWPETFCHRLVDDHDTGIHIQIVLLDGSAALDTRAYHREISFAHGVEINGHAFGGIVRGIGDTEIPCGWRRCRSSRKGKRMAVAVAVTPGKRLQLLARLAHECQCSLRRSSCRRREPTSAISMS